ncbi:MAG: hypothetical protein DDT35_01066 [Firmicutes bacterium]|nr:hypothetical protein [Bacillota bacterium]
MGAWLTWVIIGLLLVGLEIVTPSFFIIFFGIGALAAGAIAALGLNLPWQLFAFLVVTLIGLFGLRKFVQKGLAGPATKTNYNSLVGKTGLVTTAIAAETGLGRVTLSGEDWAALAETNAAIEVGAKVTVVSVSGVRLIVRRAEDSH